jgi:transposase
MLGAGDRSKTDRLDC